MARLFEKQGWHLVSLLLLLAGVFAIRDMSGMQDGQLWGVETRTWFVIAIAMPIIHQAFVALAWRMQLHTQWITRSWPRFGFTLYVIVFFLLLASRLIFIILLGLSNANTLPLAPIIRYGLAVVLLGPVLAVGYSIQRHFGLVRATGADHFDSAYREKPLVKAGIFKVTSNPMYWFGMLAFWIPALALGSIAALVVALFGHIAIWAHFHFTEKPDMARIYGNSSS